MIKVKFYDEAEVDKLKFAVIISRKQGKWVLCRHKGRDTYEVPGGHRIHSYEQQDWVWNVLLADY